MSSPVRWCATDSTLRALLDAGVAAESSVLTLRGVSRATGEDEAEGPGRVRFQSGGVFGRFLPYPTSPEQVMRETVLTPPPGLDAAGRMLHALRAEVTPEMTVVVEAVLSDGYSRWTLLYTRRGMLVAHRHDY